MICLHLNWWLRFPLGNAAGSEYSIVGTGALFDRLPCWVRRRSIPPLVFVFGTVVGK